MKSSPNEKKEGGDPHSQSPPPTPSKQSKTVSRYWRRAFNKLKSNGQLSAGKAAEASNPPQLSEAGKAAEASNPPPLSEADKDAGDYKIKAISLIQLMQADLKLMDDEADSLQIYNNQLTSEILVLGEFLERFNKLDDWDKQKWEGLNRLRMKLMKVKLSIPSNSKYKVGGGEDKNEHQKNLKFKSEVEQSICGEESKNIPQLYNVDLFKTSMEFKDFEARYRELEMRLQLCLLCFSIFPQGATVKKRLMLQWWVVEGFASSEQEAEGYFKTLMEKGFIEAVNHNRSLSVGSCRIHPFHRSVLVALAERAKLFNFGSEGDPTQSFSGSFQACLMGAGLISYDDFKAKNTQLGKGGDVKVIKELMQELEKLHLLMNVDEHILEFIGDWFAKMKNLNILYLGRWKAEATHHIEVEDPKFLDKLGNMKFVKFLSLQGVSNIISLPNSILQLTNLDVLDLRACSNLESIPDRINYLQKLTHLDMSECYLLADMPKGLSFLTNLKVLKGFFVSKGNKPSKICTLEDLQKLKHLEKLCIFTNCKDFPLNHDVGHLQEFKALNKLTITWGVRDEEPSATAEAEAKQLAGLPPARLPPNLKKLDLKCFPKADPPDWLKLKNMEEIELKKLYIRGGKLCDLGQYQGIDEGPGGCEKKWSVEQLRLKYLREIEMEWRQLQGLFPKLKYLEKVSCPNLTLFPCDVKGVWINPE